MSMSIRLDMTTKKDVLAFVRCDCDFDELTLLRVVQGKTSDTSDISIGHLGEKKVRRVG